MTPEEVIRTAARNFRLVKITYTKQSNEETEVYTCEPYEIKEGKFFGYALERDGIRAFFVERIIGAAEVDEIFTPRWPIKL